jgi:hypothetical protein
VVAKAASRVVTREDWKVQGVDVLQKTLSPGIKEQLTHYGELVQAAYDNLGLDECARAQYGNAVQPPDQLLAYTQGNYSVAEGHKGPVQSTNDRYKLPTAFKDAKLNTVVSPYIEALPGKGDDGGLPSPAEKLAGDIWTTIVNNIFATVPGLLVTFIDGNNGGRALFTTDKMGRKKTAQGLLLRLHRCVSATQGRSCSSSRPLGSCSSRRSASGRGG